MATTPVNNPTNAPVGKFTPIPFIRSASGKADALVRPEAKDIFNTGKDYQDEGAPLLTGDYSVKANQKLAVAMVQGLIGAPTQAELDAVSRIDETSQTQVKRFTEAVVMDVDAKLIISTMDQMKKGIFREAHYPTMQDYLKSPHYRRMRETRIITERLAGIAQKTRLRESATIAGVRLNPRLVTVFNKVDKSILDGLEKSGFMKEAKRLRESLGVRMKEQGESFSQEANWDGGTSAALAGREPDFIPLIAGPFNKQLYWFDYLDMHAKAYEASTHNPIAKRIVKVISQFVLGKGVKLTVMRAVRKSDAQQANADTQQLAQRISSRQSPITVPDYKEKTQEVIDRHWTQNSLHIRSKQILKDLVTFGEQFIRYFDAPWGLKIRQMDPSTVWEVITDPDDCENEFYVHQQYPTRYQWYVDLPVPTIKFIIRQVPSMLYYHMKINSTAGEVRGRSELFAILGWLKRLKEWASDRVVRNKISNLFVMDVAVEGDQSAVSMVQAQFATPPTPGSFFIHNKAAELTAVAAELGASDAQNDWQVFLTLAAMGAGVSLQYLGADSAQGGKAQALVGTEPDIKSFEDHQEFMEQFFLQDAQRVVTRAKERGELPPDLEVTVEVTFPTLAEENRSEKLKDLAFGESMSWWSHRRVASAAAKEMQMTSYTYDEEQKQIAQEDAMKEFLINTAYQQVTKGVDNSRSALGGMGGGGTSSGASGKGASGMGFGRLPGAAGSGSSGSTKTRGSGEAEETAIIDGRKATHESEAEDDSEDEAPTTAPGSSSFSRVSGYTTTHNASTGDRRTPWDGSDVDASTGRKDHYRGRDPRDVASSVKREATNLRYERRGVGRRQDRIETPNKIRDQKSMDRGEIINDAKQALKSGNLGHESTEGGPGSGPHPSEGKIEERKYGRLKRKKEAFRELQQRRAEGEDVKIYKRIGQYTDFYGKGRGIKGFGADSYFVDNPKNQQKARKSESKKPMRFPRTKEREAMEPFKPQDGERLQKPRTEDYPTEKNAHSVVTGKKNNPRGYGASKKERI